jgi:diguanylate cyclase (GGDEF)-like protein
MHDGEQLPEGGTERSGAQESDAPARVLTDEAAKDEALGGEQTASDADQAGSDQDEMGAVADQRASDRDQAAADREHAADSAGGVDEVYEASRADRLQGTLERVLTSRARALTAAQRVEHAAQRDETADRRDLRADRRDRAAEQRDLAAAELDREREMSGQSERHAAAGTRDRAGADRARAADDREHAAADRAAAAVDREQARDELGQAELDPLTGALGRGLGMVALEHEINRARHGDGQLVLAFVDIDDLKQVNDRQGHGAGDAVIRAVVAGMQAQLRSYDPVVRLGGDEFVCALADCTPAEARRRFALIRAGIEQIRPGASISVGLAPLRADDTLEQLIQRGDTALYDAKHGRSRLS